MEMQMMNFGGLMALQSCLGYKTEHSYNASSECSEILEEIISILLQDDERMVSRQMLSTSNILTNDLIPIIKYTDDLEVFQRAIELLKLLSQPMDLLTCPPSQIQDGLKLDISRMYEQIYSSCISPDFLMAIVRMVHVATGKKSVIHRDRGTMTMIDNCFLLLRNLFHNCQGTGLGDSSHHLQIYFEVLLKFLFKFGFDKMILNMLELDREGQLSMSIGQVIFYMFKDYADEILQKDVPEMRCYSDDDEDDIDEVKMDENIGFQNTYNFSGMYDALTTENGTNATSGIESSLKEFAKNFIKSGLNKIVQKFLDLMSKTDKQEVNDIHLLWIVSYFTKYVTCHYDEMPEHLHQCLFSSSLCSGLIYKIVVSCESLMLLQQKNRWNTSSQKRLHLGLTSLYHIFKLCGVEADKEETTTMVEDFQIAMANMRSLQSLFVMLLNEFQPHLQGTLYLFDLIQTNHEYIILMDKWIKQSFITSDDSKDLIFDLVSKYGTKQIMKTLSIGLASFESNPPELNSSILTLMHHVAGDINKEDTLIQLPIIVIFGQIWEKNSCMDFMDLIECTLQNFITASASNPDDLSEKMFQDEGLVKVSESDSNTKEMALREWSEEEQDLLMVYWADDYSMEAIVEALHANGLNRTLAEVRHQMVSSGMIQDQNASEMNDQSWTASEEMNEDSYVNDVTNKLVQAIHEDGDDQLMWLQRQLIDTAKAKAYLKQGGVGMMLDPIPLSYLSQRKSVPLMVFTTEEKSYFEDKKFVTLLELLEIDMPVTDREVFPRIPHTWNISSLVEKAKILGTVTGDDLEFFDMFIEEEVTALGDDMDMAFSCGSELFSKSLNAAQTDDTMWMSLVQQLNSK